MPVGLGCAGLAGVIDPGAGDVEGVVSDVDAGGNGGGVLLEIDGLNNEVMSVTAVVADKFENVESPLIVDVTEFASLSRSS